MKIFVVSIAALQPDTENGGSRIAHRGNLMSHESTEDAIRFHTEEALALWPLSDGWRGHSAHVSAASIMIAGSDPRVPPKVVIEHAPMPAQPGAVVEITDLDGEM